MTIWFSSLIERPLIAPWRQYFIVSVCLAVLVASTSAFNAAVRRGQAHDLIELKQKVLLEASQKRTRLEGELSAVSSLTGGMVAYITAYHQDLDHIQASDTDLMMATIYTHAKNIRSIALAPGNRITYTYPHLPNRGIIGAYYPDLKAQWPTVQKAIELKKPVLAGPTKLLQGGRGFVHRTPVFLKDGRYWGLLSVVLKSDAIFKEAGLLDQETIEYALQGQDGLGAQGSMIIGREELFSGENIVLSVQIPAGEWRLAARPKRGWHMYDEHFRWMRVIGFAISLLISGLLYYLLHVGAGRLLARARLQLSQFTLDHALDSIVWTDARGRVVYLNETTARLTQHTATSGIGLPIWELNPDFSQQDWEMAWRSIREKGQHTLDTIVSMPDGTDRYYEATINYVRQGDIELAVSFARDLTARRQAEEAIKESERQTAEALNEARRLAHIVNHTNNAVVLTDQEGLIEWVNAGFTRMTGYSLDEVVGRRPGALLQGKDTDPNTAESMRKHIREQREVRVEILNYTKQGKPFWVDIELQPLYGDAGNVTGFMAIQSDITERKEAEQRLEEAQRIAHLGFWEFDNVNLTVLWSDETYRIAGMAPGTPIDTLERVQSMVHSEDLSAFMKSLQDMVMHDQPVQLEYRAFRTDGEIRYLRLIGQNARGEDGQVVKLFGIVQDVTEQKQAEKLKNEFISTVSHELRTPLTALRGALGLLGQVLRANADDRTRQLLEVSGRNAERLALLINDLLDMEKISAGKMEFHFETLSLNHQVELAVSANQPYGERFGVRYRVWNEDPELQVEVDTHRLQQVMANLLSNAAKFSAPDNSPLQDGRVDVYIGRKDGFVRIAVQDYGLGIVPEKHERLFQKFTQLDTSDSRAKGGTGLGLAICKALVEHMGGRIGFVSAAGSGSTFWFELPVKQ